jgi:hypothetical protein
VRLTEKRKGKRDDAQGECNAAEAQQEQQQAGAGKKAKGAAQPELAASAT